MKKIAVVLLIIALTVSCISCGVEKQRVAASYEIAISGDIGEFTDGGFNQSAYQGIKNFATKNGRTFVYFQPGNGAKATQMDRLFALYRAVESGAQIIVVPGAAQKEAVKIAAEAHPGVKFVFVDGQNMEIDNVTSVSFKEQEAGFLAGYAAVMDGYTKLGGSFGGGGTIAACNRYALGYVQGADAAAKVKESEVTVKISFKYGNAFAPSEELKEQMSDWYAKGTEVVFSCGGAMFTSVKEACDETENGRIIGVDVDKSDDSDRVLTSAIKGVEASVERVLEDYYKGKWNDKLAGKSTVLGISEGAVGIPTNESSWRFASFTLSQYEEIVNQIKAGEMIIASEVPDNMDSLEIWTFIDEQLSSVTVEFE